MSAGSVTHGPAIKTSQSEDRTIRTDQSETRHQSRDPGTAEMNLILTDINMICVTDMSHKYFTLYEPNMKTFYIWSLMKYEQPTHAFHQNYCCSKNGA